MYPYMFPVDIEGYMSPSECEELYRRAIEAPAGAVVELGTYKGRSAVAMALTGRTVYAVDRFAAESEEFHPYPDHRDGRFSADVVRANAQRYGVNVVVIDGQTADVGQAWERGPVGLLHIDADHHYEGVSRDFAAWEPHLAPGAIVVFDDSLWPGVQQFLLELREWAPIPGPQVGGLTAMRRVHAET